MIKTWYDIQCSFGGLQYADRTITSVETIINMLNKYTIDKCLVRLAPADFEIDLPFSNEKLYSACGTDKRLIPCPAVIPNADMDMCSEEEQVVDILSRGASCVWIRPRVDAWPLLNIIYNKLFTLLEARRLPLFIEYTSMPVKELSEIASHFPALPILLTEVGYREHRTLCKLLETFPNLYVCVGGTYAVSGGISQLVNSIAGNQLLFGTGFPYIEPMVSIAQLAYEAIHLEQKQAIAAGTMQHLEDQIIR